MAGGRGVEIEPRMAEDSIGGRSNWSGNLAYSTARLLQPATVADVQRVVRGTERLRVLGSGHSFNDVADSTVAQLSLAGLNTMELNRAAGTVTIGGGVRYGELAPWLEERGYALHNLASLPHITVVGACSTGTHGSGVRNGNLATAVRALELVDGRGELVRLSQAETPERFRAAVVGLGALGVVTQLTLEVQPSFSMSQLVYLDLPFTTLEENFEAILGAGYSVSLFTDWQAGRATQVWIKNKRDPEVTMAPPAEFYGARAATRRMHPLLDHPAGNCTEQMGIAGAWYQRLPHFALEFTPSSGEELQSEYFVAREQGMAAIRAVEELRDHITPLLLVGELRTVAADDLWLSPCYGRDSLALHFTWKLRWSEVRPVLAEIEARLKPFAARPHWAKLFTMPAEVVRSRYPQMAGFRQLTKAFDPQGRFRNSFVERYLS